MNPLHEETTNEAPKIATVVNAVEQVPVAETVTEATVLPTQPVVQKKSRRMIYGAFILGLVIALLAGAYYVTQIRNDDSVAVVNGVKISRKDYDDSVALIKQNATQQGVTLSDPSIEAEIKNQAIDTLVNNALLIGGAKAAGFVADETKAKSQYDELATTLGGEEALKARMQEVGLSEEKLRSNINERILVDAFLESKTNIKSLTVTDEEIQTFYDSISTGNAEIPPLEQVRDQVESQLLSEKQQAVVTEFLTTLKKDARIDIKI